MTRMTNDRNDIRNLPRFRGGLGSLWTTTALAALAATATTLIGCADNDVAVDPPAPAATSAYLVDTEPDGAVGVGEARETAKDAQPVTLTGRIGGSREPFVEGLAVFTIVDPKVPHCADEEGCPTPWDYCCTPSETMKANTATVQLVDESGAPLAQDARETLGVKELSEVVVQGEAQRDDAGNLVVLAQRVYVKK